MSNYAKSESQIEECLQRQELRADLIRVAFAELTDKELCFLDDWHNSEMDEGFIEYVEISIHEQMEKEL